MKISAQPADQRASATFGTVKKPDDYVRQTCSTDHQRQREQNHVQLVVHISGVITEAQFTNHFVQLGQQRQTGFGVLAEHAKHRGSGYRSAAKK